MRKTGSRPVIRSSNQLSPIDIVQKETSLKELKTHSLPIYKVLIRNTLDTAAMLFSGHPYLERLKIKEESHYI